MLGGALSGLLSRSRAATQDIRQITPPRLSEPYLGKKILCYRPMRHGAPNMSVDGSGSQILIHNYGHGGSGWTLAPGAAGYVIDLLEAQSKRHALAKSEPIAIVGAGVIGLFTAYELVRRGYQRITVVADQFDGLTSDNAGGLLAPVSMDNTPAMQAVINKIGIDAYRFYRSVAEGSQKDFKKGALVVPAYFQSRADSGLEPYVGVVMQPAKDVILNFGNGTQRSMVAYDDSIFMDTAVLMAELNAFLKPFVTFEKKTVKRFEDLPQRFVFNCSGLGSAALSGDTEMVSVQGHLVMLKDQVPKDLQYMILIYLDAGKTASGQSVKRSFYIFPKHLPGSGVDDVGVIGGTFIKGATSETPNLNEFTLMLNGAKRFYGL
jgi:hypothetical protein